jgi:hypothetical protein
MPSPLRSATARFATIMIDGYHLGKLSVPCSQIADWLNFLVAPQYRIEIVSAEQTSSQVEIYFQASEGLYLYLDMRLNQVDAALAG